MPQYDRREIENRAFAIWEQEGCPHGKDQEHWTRAVAELEREASQRSKAKATAKKNAEKETPSKTANRSRPAASARSNTSAKSAKSAAANNAAQKGEVVEPKKVMKRRKS